MTRLKAPVAGDDAALRAIDAVWRQSMNRSRKMKPTTSAATSRL